MIGILIFFILVNLRITMSAVGDQCVQYIQITMSEKIVETNLIWEFANLIVAKVK